MPGIAEKIQTFCSDLEQTCMSMVKIAMLSKSIAQPPHADKGSEMVILGNGPSLRPMIETKRNFLEGKSLLAVNFAVQSDYFTQLKPKYYVVADPAFFANKEYCARLIDNMTEKTDWEMDFYTSALSRKVGDWQEKLSKNQHIHVHYFNMTPVEGFRWFKHLCYRKGWGMPRPRNVLIPSIMLALSMGYDTIYVAGADHSWLKEVWVNDDNMVMEDLHHFYDKKGSQEYKSDKHLHDLLLSMSIAFRSYHVIKDYAETIGKKIINVTEGSYIDAFERKKIE
jgi:hypothetical protein